MWGWSELLYKYAFRKELNPERVFSQTGTQTHRSGAWRSLPGEEWKALSLIVGVRTATGDRAASEAAAEDVSRTSCKIKVTASDSEPHLWTPSLSEA